MLQRRNNLPAGGPAGHVRRHMRKREYKPAKLLACIRFTFLFSLQNNFCQLPKPRDTKTHLLSSWWQPHSTRQKKMTAAIGTPEHTAVCSARAAGGRRSTPHQERRKVRTSTKTQGNRKLLHLLFSWRNPGRPADYTNAPTQTKVPKWLARMQTKRKNKTVPM